MNRIQKAATAVVALTITLVGGTLATAPLALTDSPWAAAHLQSHHRRVATSTTQALRDRAAARASA